MTMLPRIAPYTQIITRIRGEESKKNEEERVVAPSERTGLPSTDEREYVGHKRILGKYLSRRGHEMAIFCTHFTRTRLLY